MPPPVEPDGGNGGQDSTPHADRQPNVNLAAGRLGIAQQRLVLATCAALQPDDGGLAGPHPGGQFGLGEAGPQTRPDQLGGNLELRGERIVRGLDARDRPATAL